MNLLKAMTIIFLFIGIYSIRGQKIITDRPDQTESSSTIPRGSLQIESGILLSYVDDNLFSIRTILAPSTLFRYGVSKSIELRVVNQFLTVKNTVNSKSVSGIADLEIGTKVQILKKEGINTEIAFLSHLVLPTGSKSVSIGNLGTISKLSISHEISKTISLGYNLGFNYFGIQNGYFTYSVAFGISITDKVGVYIEPYGEIGINNSFLSNADGGITYLLKDNFQLDFSFGLGLNNTMNYISTGFSWNIKNK